MKKFRLFTYILFFSVFARAQNPADTEPAFKLSQNFPNPARENTVIKIQLNSPGPVSLKLLDMLGNTVYSLLDDSKPAGTYFVEVETYRIPEGIYFYVLKKDDEMQTMKMVVSRK
jgi:hypothetical protein